MLKVNKGILHTRATSKLNLNLLALKLTRAICNFYSFWTVSWVENGGQNGGLILCNLAEFGGVAGFFLFCGYTPRVMPRFTFWWVHECMPGFHPHFIVHDFTWQWKQSLAMYHVCLGNRYGLARHLRLPFTCFSNGKQTLLQPTLRFSLTILFPLVRYFLHHFNQHGQTQLH